MSQAALDVVAEGERRKSVEGWTPWHDDLSAKGEMVVAASCDAVAAKTYRSGVMRSRPIRWLLSDKWWKPKTRRGSLVKSGVMILTQIKRLDRAVKPTRVQP